MLHRLIGRAKTAMAFGLSAVMAMTVNVASAGEGPDRAIQLFAAGEINQAADAVSKLSPQEKADLLARIEAAQKSNPGPVTRDAGREQTKGETKSAQPSLKGTGADFQTLMNLIQQQTSGPWQDIDGEGGTMTPFESGVRVDARGVLKRVERRDAGGSLAAMVLAARKAAMNGDVAVESDLRMVSLTRLEREIAARLERGERVPEEMKQLAGLSSVQYVFVDPASKEIVIAGPAQANGLLRLDDLVTLLRTHEGRGKQMFGCSIDPRAEGLAAVKTFAEESQARGPLGPGQAKRFAQQIGDTLGRQDITTYGVPADSRVARVIVEADYLMKLIGVGKVEGGKNVPSYFDLLAKQPSLATGGLDALRWWMTLNLDEVRHNDARTAFELKGTAVKCLSENQFITATGGRTSTGKAEPINRQFAEGFTKNYAELAAAHPVFADLKGVFELAMVAALIQNEGLDVDAGWNRGVFASAGSFRTGQYAVPKEVDSVVNHRVFNGKDVVVQVAGGVRADVVQVISNPEVRKESTAPAETVAKAGQSPEGRWWWDAAR
ncbi:hypothetical protein Pan44_13850 [Caulifigura coniformis]|uniref:DUF1598 domain-containing protein n=1 Tax=Caulifigura coniformis TaxID=2527983 RepID=A0A517SB69_9PLAN|nr:DUF1598 domain-containing protein [Caulifigura coniformis]QDT53368.1 hypothetical protein Pan44_13850 [Caulifigura coniformis]